MIQIRKTRSALVMAFLAAALASCGGSPDAPSGAAGSPAGSSEPVTSSDTGPAGRDRGAGVETTTGPELGPPLADPSRYYGVYAAAERPDRQWFVTEARRPEDAEQAPEVPPGHLALGAMFGDVAPFHLRTVSRTEFAQAWVSDHEPGPISIEFELDDAGRAVALRFTDERFASFGRLERRGGLPEGWE